MQIFWRHGYEATSLTMLIESMRLSKSSFYQAFESKEVLFQRCLTHYADDLVATMMASLECAPSGLAFLRATLLGVADESPVAEGPRGCLVMNTANEFGQRQPTFARLVARHAGRFERVFEHALERAEREGEWVATSSRRSMARYLVSSLSGLKTMAKAGASRATLREIATMALLVLDPSPKA